MKLTNGDPVPPLHDGMGAFRLRRDITALVRNHEIDVAMTERVDPGRVRPYDPLGTGGTTTLWVNEYDEVVHSFASLSGTFRNCAGGATPWNTWLTAEECTYLPGPLDPVNHDRTPHAQRRHGYVFEVDARAEELVEPVPIVAMGRFYHEALCVDPKTGFVYLSEDRDDGLFYRYRPDVVVADFKAPLELGPGDLARGGVLEALKIVERPSARTQNWMSAEPPSGAVVDSATHGGQDDAPAPAVRDSTQRADSLAAACDARAFAGTRSFSPIPESERIPVGQRFRVSWVRIPDVDPDMDMERDPEDPFRSADSTRLVGEAKLQAPRFFRPRTAATSTRAQGQRLGAAQFARGEGLSFDPRSRSVYLCCTNGGQARAGQVWKLDVARGELSLVCEPDDRAVLDGPDNIIVAPNGDLIVCEDGCMGARVVGITPRGAIYVIAANAFTKSELAGACFSYDGEVLFVNVQNPGITFAIRGPWGSRRSS
jgi:hypothetical protein